MNRVLVIALFTNWWKEDMCNLIVCA
uniref:Uncharacterized protein n=1 Tax=Rhodnius prolixus TaxID=13249 RepID=T1HWG7_RHOPR